MDPAIKELAISNRALTVDPTPLFALSPYLYMQFMEPLGITDGSVAAAWDAERDCWREDVVKVTRQLSPTLIRWGGCLASFYRWKEGVGPRNRRKPMLNLCWGGTETNQVGTHEFVEFCRRVGADPLFTVNLESDGRAHWANHPKAGRRWGNAREAAEWVAYCNDPDNATRRRHGVSEPLRVRLWQLGNETSYDPNGFDCETTARKSLAFARAMRVVDPTIKLIGWGDSGWAPRMIEAAGEELDYVAFHHHFGSGLPESPLRGTEYRKDPELTWRHLMNACKSTQERIDAMREQTRGTGMPLALTESHFGLGGRNRCEVQSSWAAGVALGRVLNVHARNGDVLKIATLADFCGTRWMNNAVIIPGRGRPYMMPVAWVMSLFRRHTGSRSVDVTRHPTDLDVTASRRGKRVFLHVVNVNRTRSVRVSLKVTGRTIASGRVFQIAVHPTEEIDELRPGLFAPTRHDVPPDMRWTFPAASVSAIELLTEERSS